MYAKRMGQTYSTIKSVLSTVNLFLQSSLSVRLVLEFDMELKRSGDFILREIRGFQENEIPALKLVGKAFIRRL